jgi:DNA polymerase-1
MNQAHRARSGFAMGPAPVIYNFFRQFKALVDQFTPHKIYVVLEGKPVARHEALGEYKANRKVEADDPKVKELEKFFKQVNVIVDLLKNHYPVSVVRHPTSECDDTIANLIHQFPNEDWVIASSDSDFTQLLQQYNTVRLYNPVQKKFVVAPENYDYITWKSLRGDSSDNIPGVPGVGDKTADRLASDPEALAEFISRPEVKPIFERNYNLIRFMEWTDEDKSKMSVSVPQKNWDMVRSVFSGYGFNSMIKDGAWEKIIDSFESLWNN